MPRENRISAVTRFCALAAQDRFKGWPLVGEVKLGAQIPYFGQVLECTLQTGNGPEQYYSIQRNFGWVVVFGLTADGEVITLCQWKPGVNGPSWELPPGGIGKLGPGATLEEIETRTKESYLKETGYGSGIWKYLGHTMIETGKYRGAGPEDHGLKAHMYLATGLQRQADARAPNANEIMETLMVPLYEFRHVLESGMFVETSAVVCAYKALLATHSLKW